MEIQLALLACDSQDAGADVGLQCFWEQGQDGKERHDDPPEGEGPRNGGPSRLDPRRGGVKEAAGPGAAAEPESAPHVHRSGRRQGARPARRGARERDAARPRTRNPGLRGHPGPEHRGQRGLPLGGRAPRAPRELAFDLSAETLERTWFGELAEGAELNLERSLRVGDRLDGHLVSGHVDGVGRVLASRRSGDGGVLMEFEGPSGFERWLVEKGSVTVDGVSLTVVRPRERRFEVALIPLTLLHTTLGRASAGQPVNLEADAIGKWVERLVAPRTR
ncbi:MAG: riboflavin synthase [Planctomycetes bacterium]|nr:riboflavin synthase [Planctomycetota bacterium]